MIMTQNEAFSNNYYIPFKIKICYFTWDRDFNYKIGHFSIKVGNMAF